MTYAARTKYDEPGRAARYAARSPRRHAEEWRLVTRLLEPDPWPTTVLDVPCGAGRLALEMARRGSRVRGADLSPAMRAEAERALAGEPGFQGVVPLDLEDVEAARRVEPAELVLCFRFLHHLPDEAARRRVLASLSALSSSRVLVSFHHPVSVHALARAARRLVGGSRGDRFAVTRRRLVADAAEAGLEAVRFAALSPGLRDLWAGLFRKR
jgi:SAM-dependent methyltransferase